LCSFFEPSYSKFYERSKSKNEGKKNEELCEKRAQLSTAVGRTKTAVGRIVGLFRLKYSLCRTIEMLFLKVKLDVKHIWRSVPISNVTADFLGLGCRLGGEVRLHSTSMNIANLESVVFQCQKDKNEKSDVLVPEEASSPNEVVALKSIPTVESTSVLGINWLLYSESPFVNVESQTIQPKLEDQFFRDPKCSSLCRRQIDFPLLEEGGKGPCIPAIISMSESEHSSGDDADNQNSE
jgi:hypothetical protein